VSQPAGRLPNFLIAGVAKAGTTSMAAHLAEHPAVFMSETKELHFFDQHYDRGVEWYTAQFAAADGARVVGEATPTYLTRPHALERMARLLPDARILVMLRDPVDRAHSLYWWQEHFDGPDFADAARAEMRGEPLGTPPRRFLGDSMYAPGLRQLYGLYPRESVHVVLLEELSADPAATFAGVCRFLEVDDGFVPATLGRVLNPAFRYRVPAVTAALLAVRAWRWMPFGLAARIERRNRVRNEYPPLDPGLRAELRAHFAADAAAVAELIGRDPSPWWR
jgi:hypothetical protein